MRKIPTLFKKQYADGKFIGVLHEFNSDECRDAMLYGVPTVKFDGSACAIINGNLYKRFDYRGKGVLPENCIPCQAHEDLEGHFPVWLPCKPSTGEDKWFYAAYYNYPRKWVNGTYEAVGKHFNGNLYNIEYDVLVKHGGIVIRESLKSYEEIEAYLKLHNIEGIVWWLNGEPCCKIRRKDFFIKWGSDIKADRFNILG